MSWLLLAAILVVAILGGCAIAFGSGSRAAVHNKTETTREVDPGTPVIEDILVEKDKKK